jgi:hypothetical protein
MGKKNCNTCNKFWTKKFTLVDEETGEIENGSGMATAVVTPKEFIKMTWNVLVLIVIF